MQLYSITNLIALTPTLISITVIQLHSTADLIVPYLNHSDTTSWYSKPHSANPRYPNHGDATLQYYRPHSINLYPNHDDATSWYCKFSIVSNLEKKSAITDLSHYNPESNIR